MKRSPGFPGFPEGKQRATPVPNLFFSELLPTIDSLVELKITLYAFWALGRKEGRFRYLTREEMAADKDLLESLKGEGRQAQAALDDALERAVARGTLVRVVPRSGEPLGPLYFLNSPKGRAGVAAIEAGDWRPAGEGGAPIELAAERPNVFRLYEQNIGPLTPMIAETLRDAEETYPSAWIEDALRIAVENNVRKWRYVEAILEDWHTRGRDEREDLRDTEKARRRYVEGKFADFIEH
ncbi:MAG TPA: DnaD domain protein [Anaerolineales bacterium]|nr:DnaD domain protein [Anaerolineales bacterium]